MIYESLQEELVPVEAGVVADIKTGQLRSVWLERHRGLLEARMKARRMRKRMVKAACVLVVLTWPANGVVAYATEEVAFRVTASGAAGSVLN